MLHRLTPVAVLTILAAASAGCDDSNTTGASPPNADGGGGDANPNAPADAGSESPRDGGADASTSCTSPASCPAPTSACVERTCNAGVCGEQPKAAGTAAGAQTAGDCKRSQCDGDGNVEVVADDADVPDDGNDCTDDVCTAGAPSHPPRAAGAACGTSAALKCDGAGACVGCLGASECAGEDTECSTRTCTNGVCGHDSAPLGTVVGSGQTTGDCKKVVCDGAGGTTEQSDDADVPNDGDPCTVDACDDGLPSHPSEVDGTDCGGGITCIDGRCEGCTTASSCPGDDDECKQRACIAGRCGFSFAAPGTATSTQQAGDCRRSECDGAGTVRSVADDDDVPNDGLECTSDVCASGVPSHVGLERGTACSQNGGTLCDGAGACVAPSCTDGLQNGDETGVDCGGSCGPCALEILVVPADGTTNVSVSEVIEITFAAPMDPATLTAQTSSGTCSGSLQVSSDDFVTCIGLGAPALSTGDTVATLTPAADLANGATYKVRVTSAATKADGEPIGAFTMPAGFTTETAAAPCSGSAVVISQVYGGGGNTNAVYRNDYIELRNRGDVAVSLAGWSVQYAASAGGFNGVIPLSGSIPAGGYYLVQGQGGTVGAALPTPNATSNGVNMAVGAGKVALVSSAASIESACKHPDVVDLVGWGNASCSEGTTRAPGTSNTTALVRKGDGCVDTDESGADFVAAAPAPRNAASPTSVCVCTAAPN